MDTQNSHRIYSEMTVPIYLFLPKTSRKPVGSHSVKCTLHVLSSTPLSNNSFNI